MQFLAKKWPNNRLALGKSWIRHWILRFLSKINIENQLSWHHAAVVNWQEIRYLYEGFETIVSIFCRISSSVKSVKRKYKPNPFAWKNISLSKSEVAACMWCFLVWFEVHPKHRYMSLYGSYTHTNTDTNNIRILKKIRAPFTKPLASDLNAIQSPFKLVTLFLASSISKNY